MQGLLWHGFQTHPVVNKAKSMLEQMDLQFFYLDMVDYYRLVRSHGKDSGLRVLADLHQFLQAKAAFTSALVEPIWDDAFLIIAPADVDLFSWLNEYGERSLVLENGLRLSISFHAGVAWIQGKDRDQADLTERMFQALEHASKMGKLNVGSVNGHLTRFFNHILVNNLITPYYQPIVEMATGAVLGYEALARGPEDSQFHMPGPLFEYGTRLGQLFLLEQVCRETAIASAPVGGNERLFLNINPQTLNDPNFVKGRTKQWAAQRGLHPSQIVFEITENEAIADYPTFRKTIDHYRDQGFQIAIDDTGSGYSGLLTLVELNPHFIKLDRGLVDQIDRSSRKQAMVEAMVMVANKIGAKTIAEGIETAAEHKAVAALGVDYGQGFLFGRPAPGPTYRSRDNLLVTQ